MFIIKEIVALYLIIFHFWMRFPEKIRFLLVGGYNTLISYLIYALICYCTLEKYPQMALFLSFIFSSPNSYLTQKFYVFNTRGNYVKEYFKCMISWTVGYGLNAVVLYGLLLTGLNPYLAQFLAVTVITINNYLLLKYFAFSKKSAKQ